MGDSAGLSVPPVRGRGESAAEVKWVIMEVWTMTGYITKQAEPRDTRLMSTRVEDSAASTELVFTRD